MLPSAIISLAVSIYDDNVDRYNGRKLIVWH